MDRGPERGRTDGRSGLEGTLGQSLNVLETLVVVGGVTSYINIILFALLNRAHKGIKNKLKLKKTK